MFIAIVIVLSVVVWNVTAKDAICGSPAQKASDGLPYVLACANNTNKIFVTAGRYRAL